MSYTDECIGSFVIPSLAIYAPHTHRKAAVRWTDLVHTDVYIVHIVQRNYINRFEYREHDSIGINIMRASRRCTRIHETDYN